MESSRYLITPLATSTPFTSHSSSKFTQFQEDTSNILPYSESLHPVLNNKASNDVQTRRQKIVKEIFDTEHSYISQLNTIIVLFLKPIRVGCLLPHNVIPAIFSNIEAILSVNKELFSCMRQRSLAEAFTYLGPFLKLYSTYANNFKNANTTLQDWLKSNDEFSRFVASQEVRPECCALQLSSLLITPIQRIPRYKLLLNDLLKHTRVTHPDYNKLSAAASQIESIATHINEHIRHHENFKKMLLIQNSLSGRSVPGILAPAREFIHEGKLMKICYRKPKERALFLFSDILMYARPKLIKSRDHNRRYECRCVLPLLNSTAEIIDQDNRVPGITAFLKVSNVDATVLFYSENSQETFNWVRIMQDTIQTLRSTYGSSVIPQKTEHKAEDNLEETNPESLHSITTAQCLDLGTLTPKTPYPLIATLFSTHAEDANCNHMGKRLDYNGQTDTLDSHNNRLIDASEEDNLFSERSQNNLQSHLPQSRCCVVS